MSRFHFGRPRLPPVIWFVAVLAVLGGVSYAIFGQPKNSAVATNAIKHSSRDSITTLGAARAVVDQIDAGPAWKTPEMAAAVSVYRDGNTGSCLILHNVEGHVVPGFGCEFSYSDPSDREADPQTGVVFLYFAVSGNGKQVQPISGRAAFDNYMLTGSAPATSATTTAQASATASNATPAPGARLVAAGGWSVVPSPADGAFSAVSCISVRVCTAVGIRILSGNARQLSGLRGVPLAARWNGSRWLIQQTPKPAGSKSSELVGVSCTSRAFCMAVGSDKGGFSTFVERWNGSTWSIQPIPRGFRATGVSCTSQTTCIAVGGGPYSDGLTGFDGGAASVGVWNGSAWSLRRAPRGGLSDVSCASATMCVAVGSNAANRNNLAERWDGAGWSIQRIPTPGILQDWLSGVSCPSVTACTAVGSSIFDSSGDAFPAVERWNGTHWSLQRTTPSLAGSQTSKLSHVSCASANACVAVGSKSQIFTGQAVAESWNGSAWAIQRGPTFGSNSLSELNGVSCTSPTACMVVGSFTPAPTLITKTATLVERHS